MVAFNVCIVAATADTSPATIGTVIATVPIVLALAGPLLEGRRPAPAIIVSACVVAAGAGLASGFGGGSARGLLLSLGALAGEVCFSLLAVPLLPRPRPAAGLRLLRRARRPDAAGGRPRHRRDGGAARPDRRRARGLRLPVGRRHHDRVPALVRRDRRLGADRAGLFAGLIPVSAVITTVVLGIDRPGPADLAGAALVAAGVVLGLRSRVAPVNPRFPSP
ncbi:hypothetical protein [Actinomadura madurae]|uniref:hypothetical protein n=1 Tax=Actinomadura madurae TaxID=1993 RepID=UPI0020D2179C|nr:hypothetical protein [Actinomadura madurae]MCP9979478.1 hypothetical protein [Actinomadura madurae]